MVQLAKMRRTICVRLTDIHQPRESISADWLGQGLNRLKFLTHSPILLEWNLAESIKKRKRLTDTAFKLHPILDIDFYRWDVIAIAILRDTCHNRRIDGDGVTRSWLNVLLTMSVLRMCQSVCASSRIMLHLMQFFARVHRLGHEYHRHCSVWGMPYLLAERFMFYGKFTTHTMFALLLCFFAIDGKVYIVAQ